MTGFLGRAEEKKEGKEKRSGEVAGAGSGGGGSPGESGKKRETWGRNKGPDLAKWRGWEWGWREFWGEQREAQS